MKFNVLKIGQARGEAREIADIITNKGIFEVTVVLSNKDQYSAGEVFWGSNEIENVSKKLINNKIKSKANQNKAMNIVIDCTFMHSLFEKLVSSNTPGIKSDFDVFKKITKKVFIFSRNPVNNQVGILKQI